MPHVLAGPVRVKAGEQMEYAIALREEFSRGGFMLEVATRSGRFPRLDRLRGLYPPIWSPLVLPTFALVRELEIRGMSSATPVCGVVHEGEKTVSRQLRAPVDGYYRIIQEQTQANPRATCSATLRRNHGTRKTLGRLLARWPGLRRGGDAAHVPH